MTNMIIPNPPVIVSITPITFFGTKGFCIKGTEDTSNLPDGETVGIKVFDRSKDNNTLNPMLTTVNSDGSWQISTSFATAGDHIYARAFAILSNGGPGASSPNSPMVVVP
ncbi:UNVERIFIED_ORG: hypothetical protein BCL66_11316 [Martelella mediterranea]